MLCTHYLLDFHINSLHAYKALHHCLNEVLLKKHPMGMRLRCSSDVNNIELLCVLGWKVENKSIIPFTWLPEFL